MALRRNGRTIARLTVRFTLPHAAVAAALALSLAPGARARSQSAAPARPYLFATTPVAGAGRGWLASVEAGYARRSFQPIGGEGVGQALALWAPVTRSLSLFVRGGLAADGRATRTSLEGELRAVAHPAGAAGTYLLLGAGALRAYDATGALRLRAGAGHAFARSRVDADLTLERPLARDRDAIDLVTTLGWMREVGARGHLGAEAVGQDLEGFWDSQEAEGGARLFAGPSGSLDLGAWRLGAAAGPVIRATQSGRTSGAVRPLSTSGDRLGFGLRTAVSYRW